MQTQIILCGVSGSGKTTLMQKLIKLPQVTRPTQFTTRKPRSDTELDEYVFLTEAQFARKLENGDFAENTYYNGNYYGISAHFDRSKSNIFIVEPVGKACLEKFFKVNDIKFVSFFLEIPIEEAKSRLMNRGETIPSIKERIKDFKYFIPSSEDIVLDGLLETEKNYNKILQWVS